MFATARTGDFMKNRFYTAAFLLSVSYFIASKVQAQGLVGMPDCPRHYYMQEDPASNWYDNQFTEILLQWKQNVQIPINSDEHYTPVISLVILFVLMFAPLPVRTSSPWLRSSIELCAAIIVPIAVKLLMVHLTFAASPLSYGL